MSWRPDVTWVKDLVDNLPHDALKLMLSDLDVEMWEMLCLFEDPDLKVEFKSWIETLPDFDRIEEWWNHGAKTFDQNKESSEARNMLQTAQYDKLVVYEQ